MTYRDDHDAALARIEALEEELAQLRGAESTDLEAELAAAVEERDRLRGQLAVLRGNNLTPLAIESLAQRFESEALVDRSQRLRTFTYPVLFTIVGTITMVAVNSAEGALMMLGGLVYVIALAVMMGLPAKTDVRDIAHALRDAPHRIVQLDCSEFARSNDVYAITIGIESATMSFTTTDRDLYADLCKRCGRDAAGRRRLAGGSARTR